MRGGKNLKTSLLEDRSCHFALETGLWREVLTSYLQGLWVKRNPVNPIGLGCFPLPPPPFTSSRKGPQGPPFRFRHADPLKFQGPKRRPRRRPADEHCGNDCRLLKAAEPPTISIPKEKFEFLYQVLSGLSPHPCLEVVPLAQPASEPVLPQLQMREQSLHQEGPLQPPGEL